MTASHKHLTRRNLVLGTVAGAATSLHGACFAADAYPSRPIRIVVPFSSGGPTDTVARILAERLTEVLRQPVIVDNHAGAGGNIGTSLVAKSPADGYSLLLGTNNQLAANISIFSKLPYDPVKDFAPVGMVYFSPSMLAVHPRFPARNVAEFVAEIRQKPAEYSFASGGIGASSHFAGELMNKLAGVHMTHVPYKSDGLAVNDCIAGQVPIVFCNVFTGMKFHQSGQLRALGVTSAKRAPAFPDIPTISEAGLPGFDISAWFCVMAPARTPAPILETLNKSLNQVLQDPGVSAKIIGMGGIPSPSTPRQVADLIRTETPKWGSLAKEANIHLD
ncbi:MAG: tripartite tricarboxylate transporter substrate binding protein [Pseudomonadota bacterium]